jgi:Tfp pilus assembly protein PilN
LAVAACWAVVLFAAHIWVNAAWTDDSSELVAQIERADAQIKDLERQSAAARAALTEAQATLRARKAVQDQPDWGLLLATLASRLDQRAVLSGCSLEPAGENAARRDPVKTMIRPSRYTLALTGLTRTQDAATALAIALEGTGIFERVSLLEARRAGFRGEDAVSFRLECALADPAAEVQ